MIEDSLVRNPYDQDSFYILDILRKSVPYLEKQSDELLKRLFLRSKSHFFEYDH